MVSQAVLLDAGPLGLFANPRLTAATASELQWLGAMLTAGLRILVPAVADYEVRRELLRLRAVKSIAALDTLVQRLEYLPLTRDALHLAAAYWAQARQGGYPTAPNPASTVTSSSPPKPRPSAHRPSSPLPTSAI